MTNRWKTTVAIGTRYRDDSLPFEERRDLVVTKIRAALPTLPDGEDEYFAFSDYSDLDDLVDCLATSTDVEMFDSHFDAFYSYADATGVWVDGFADD